jgi:hypothetical protein
MPGDRADSLVKTGSHGKRAWFVTERASTTGR